ncbi:MAG: S41 family peptidase [candidate division Zixibacteria bacterium]|nr:S41 family peptidase [candidate division Zixibacteria bacterium]NIR67572.1 S41 family peptidase [candidate division Zixibacteria bacterium]NIS16139.1 S41 family peptidase [candidate division Zixibacteria bacterium]NIS48833.1 S41 family peptidase [candidate division Zixibacteria bacterium]NIT52542.1 S41 family peptidase [candidate division Zixibacteria bacterium]
MHKFRTTAFFIILNVAAIIAGLYLVMTDPLFEGMMAYATAFHIIKDNYADPIKSEDLFQGSIEKIEDGLDPFTGYIPPRSYQYYEEESQGEFSGIGVEITVRDGLLTVVSPIPGSPADRAGLKAGDQVTMIGDIDASTLDPNEAVDLIRGQPGTAVELRIRRPGLKEQFNVKIERASVQISSVEYAGMVNSTGYIRLTNFALNSLDEIITALESLKLMGMDGLVLDLRGNPGGFLEIAVAITGLFLPDDALIVSTGGRSFTEEFELRNFFEGDYQDVPMVVLVNNGSASASEILSGALQDHDRAVIMGDTTFGKGLVQNISPLPQDGALRLTVSKYYLPSGRIIQKFSDMEWSENLVKTESRAETVYRTDGGRKVYGGGGVVPDIIYDDEDPTILESVLLVGGFYFDFGVEYLQKHGNVLNLPLGQDVLDSFRVYLDSRGVHVSGPIENAFDDFMQAAKQVDPEFPDKAPISSIRAKINGIENESWEKNRDEILENLSITLSNLAYNDNEIYEKYYLRYDPVIRAAINLLENRAEYRQIVNPDQ